MIIVALFYLNFAILRSGEFSVCILNFFTFPIQDKTVFFCKNGKVPIISIGY